MSKCATMFLICHLHRFQCWFLLATVLQLLVGLSKADVVCDFDHSNYCGLENQTGLLPFALVDKVPWTASTGLMVLDLKQVNHTMAPGARLSTKYFPAHNITSACLTATFLTHGPGIVRVAFIARSIRDQRLFEYDHFWSPTTSAGSSDELNRQWVTVSLPVSMFATDTYTQRLAPVMFFIEVVTDGQTPNGLFALDYLAFFYVKCPFKQIAHYACLSEDCTVQWKPTGP